MISTSFRWTKTVAAAVLFLLSSLLYAQAFYDGNSYPFLSSSIIVILCILGNWLN